MFNLSRMKNLENTKRTFELPENFEFTSRCGGGRFGAFKDNKTVHYEIDFYDDARQFVKDCVWADDQEFIDYEEACTTTIKFSSSQSLKVLEWVLSQGVNARPRAPEEFVERWKKEIHALDRLV
nr:WYL domain-containing protein [Treponema sp.]